MTKTKIKGVLIMRDFTDKIDDDCRARFGHSNWGFLDTYTKEDLDKAEHVIENNIVYWIDDVDECKMGNKELKKIASRLEELEREMLIELGLHRHSGGFVKIDMDEFDAEKVYVTIEDGIQSDCQNTKNTTYTELWRDSLTWVD